MHRIKNYYLYLQYNWPIKNNRISKNIAVDISCEVNNREKVVKMKCLFLIR